MGGLCPDHAAAVATAEDFTAEQIIAAEVPAPTAWLIDQWGTPHGLADNTSIGRDSSSCGLAILHHSISSLHAQLSRGQDGWRLIDRSSLNGSFVDGQRIRDGAVRTGNRLGFGDVSLYFSERVAGDAQSVAGPGRTVPTRNDETSFSAILESDDHTIELAERPGGGIAQSGDEETVEFARLEFALLVALAERRHEVQNPDLAYVSSKELARSLDFRSHDADSDNVRELIRRVRKKLSKQGIDDLIESRQGVGYRLGWPLKK